MVSLWPRFDLCGEAVPDTERRGAVADAAEAEAWNHLCFPKREIMYTLIRT